MFAVRTRALRTLSRRVATFTTTPARSYASSHSHPTGTSSDMPWLIGAIVFTVPASYYLLSSGPPTPHHSDPHKKMDTASTSAGPGVQTEPSGHHGKLQLPTDKKARPLEEEEDAGTDGGDSDKLESAKEWAEDKTQEATGAVKATASKAGEKASEYAGKVKDEAEDVKDSAEEKASAIKKGAADGTDKDKAAEDSAEEKASAIKKGAADGTDKNKAAEEEEKEGKKTSVNPQKVDPGDTAMKNAGGSGTMSGKQQGISNDDTWHAVLHEPRGDAISKKGEGVHDSAKLKGTVDVNRPAK